MPNEHNLIWHAAKSALNIRENRVNPYELYACALNPDCTPHAEELFTRLVWNRLVGDCPEIKGVAEYKPGFTGKHLSLWTQKGKHAVWTPKMKKYSVKVMQRAIEALTERDKTQKYYVETYQTLLSIWGDGKLNREGKEFIKKNFILTKKTDEMNSNTLKKY